MNVLLRLISVPSNRRKLPTTVGLFSARLSPPLPAALPLPARGSGSRTSHFLLAIIVLCT